MTDSRGRGCLPRLFFCADAPDSKRSPKGERLAGALRSSGRAPKFSRREFGRCARLAAVCSGRLVRWGP